MKTLMTSDEYQKWCKLIVVDADGWDRKNYQYSWFEQKITKEEFEKRLFMSTIYGKPEDHRNIWKTHEEVFEEQL